MRLHSLIQSALIQPMLLGYSAWIGSVCWASPLAADDKTDSEQHRLACEQRILERMSGQKLNYLAKSNSIVANAERRLEPINTNTQSSVKGWKLSTHSRWMFIRIQEDSEFTWPNWRLQHYEMKRKGLSKSKNFQLNRQANGDLLRTQHKAEATVIKEPNPAFDPLNYQLRLQLDLACQSAAPLSYSLIKKNAIKTYHFKRMGDEIVATEAGDFDSLVVEKIDTRSERKTRIWFAKDYDYTLLKLEHLEKERVTVLELKEKPDHWGSDFSNRKQ